MGPILTLVQRPPRNFREDVRKKFYFELQQQSTNESGGAQLIEEKKANTQSQAWQRSNVITAYNYHRTRIRTHNQLYQIV